jgi:hypothetical protein
MWPTFRSATEAVSAAGSSSSAFRTARSVPGSLPARVAATLRPPGKVSVMSSSRWTLCAAVTTTPERQ